MQKYYSVDMTYWKITTVTLSLGKKSLTMSKRYKMWKSVL